MKNLKNIFDSFSLKLFDGDGSLDEVESSSEDEVVYGINADDPENNSEAVAENETTESANEVVDLDKEFDELIKGKYKEQYDSRVHKNISGKVTANNKLKAQLDSYSPLISELQMKYGVMDSNPEAILEAVKNDTSSYEKEAYERNMSTDELIHLKRLEAQDAKFKQEAEEAEHKALAAKRMNEWIEQAQKFSELNPAFDFKQELQNDSFFNLLKAGVPVRDAYNAIHINDIQQAAGNIREKQVVDRIKSRNNRPDELTSGLKSNVTIKNDPNNLTDEDFDRITKLVGQGKRIMF